MSYLHLYSLFIPNTTILNNFWDIKSKKEDNLFLTNLKKLHLISSNVNIVCPTDFTEYKQFVHFTHMRPL